MVTNTVSTLSKISLIYKLSLFIISILFLSTLILVNPSQAKAESSLKQVFDGYFGPGVIDTTKETGRTTFPKGKYNVTLIAKLTGAPYAPNGWYLVSNRNQLNEIFPGYTQPLTTKQIDIPEEFGLWIQTFGLWRSEPSFNSDRFDHFAVFDIPGGGYAIGIEDLPGGGDADFQDHILAYVVKEIPKTPVIFIPGIGGSEFKSTQTFSPGIKDCATQANINYQENEIVWVNKIVAGASGCDDYFDVLKLQADGQTPQYPQVVLSNTIFQDSYGGAIQFLKESGYEPDKTLFIYPYDWRKDIALTVDPLNNLIQDIKQKTGSQKVDIVAHSMGGLVAKNYISDPNKAQNVRKLVTLGTPYLGSVNFLKAIRYGDCFTDPRLPKEPLCLGLNPPEVKDIIQNMPGGYELAPTQKYFAFYSNEDALHPYPFKDVRDIDNDGVTGSLNYSQIKTLLTNLGHNTSLFTPSEIFHNLDNNLFNTNNVDVSIIAGSGIDTLGQVIEGYLVDFGGIKIPHKDLVKINGDDTVPLLSASLIDPHKNLFLADPNKVYYTNQKHGDLPFNGPAMNLVRNILNNNSELPTGIARQPYKLAGNQLSVHSPVNIHVYDQNNNHTGPLVNEDFEANIPGSSYEILDDAKFIWLPDDGVYTVKFEATDQGSFDFKIRNYKDDINDQTILYKDIPLTKDAKAETVFDTSSTQPPILKVDEDGNGSVDTNVEKFSILEGEANYDYTPPTISFEVSPKVIWPPNNKMVDINISGNITDENPYLMTIFIEDEYGLVEPKVEIKNQTNINQTLKLEASRKSDDQDGRKYIVKILATDLAGNTTLSIQEIIVPHDRSN